MRGQPPTGLWKVQTTDRGLQTCIGNGSDQPAGRNRSDILSEVVSSYLEMTPEQRSHSRLELRREGIVHRTTYKDAFSRIEEYKGEQPGIFWAGAYVRRSDNAFTVWFYDLVDIGDGQSSKKPFIAISRERLKQYRFGSLLETQLLEASENRNRYLQVYFLGGLKRTVKGELLVDIDNFDHLAFIEKTIRNKVGSVAYHRVTNSQLTDRWTETVQASTPTQPGPKQHKADASLVAKQREAAAVENNQQASYSLQKLHTGALGGKREKSPLIRAWNFLKAWYRNS